MKSAAFVTLVVLSSACPADLVLVGKGGYRNDLPPGPDGKPRRSVEASPLVSSRVSKPIPTSDWWSSLVWPMHNPHSMPMFPHPLAAQTHGDGFALGYTSEALITNHEHQGKVFQRGTVYRYPFRESLRVGLDGIETDRTVVDDFSDWAVTALWKDGPDELRATFAHGSPFVFFETRGTRPVRIRFTAAEVDAHREPVAPFVHEWKGLNGRNTGKPGSIQLAVNAGKHIGVGSKARLVYDFDGDGTTDRVETLHLLATDPDPATWEAYSSATHEFDPALTHGEPADFENGTARLEVWKCFGEGSVRLNLPACTFTPPLEGAAPFPVSTADPGTIAVFGDPGEPTGPSKVFYLQDHVAGVTVNGSHFGLFAPTGRNWDLQLGGTAEASLLDLAGKSYLSVAVLPDSRPATIEWFRRYAFAFLRDTRVDYRYDAASGKVATTFTATTEAMEGGTQSTVFALYRHQHLHAGPPERFSPHRYASPRGEMRTIAGTSFTTEIPFLGVLPALPCNPADRDLLTALLRSEMERLSGRAGPFTRTDTYWNGKELGKLCELIQIAEQLGQHGIRDRLLGFLKSRLADWFDAQAPLFFHYDDRWDTLTGYPDSYGSGEQLNDHHFHYSYFVKAAATIAQYDPDWVRPDHFGGMIDTLIRDCANHDRDDLRFPWMRNFDPYAGHSWAAGHAGFASGNNQESSSESMNFATSLILYGQVTGRDEIRDLGIYWHSTEAEAIRQYWFDQDRAVFPSGFQQSCVGMIWGDGGTYGTWWTANPEEIHGINYLPLTGGSLYLGRDPAYVRRNLANLASANSNFHRGGFPGSPNRYDRWQDILLGYRALADPEGALADLDALAPDYDPEFGATRTHTRQWVGALRALGPYDASIHADHPTAVAFRGNDNLSYVVFNPTSQPLPVRFSNGTTIHAAPGLTTTRK